MFQGFRTLETLGANHQLTVTLSEQNIPEKTGGQKGITVTFTQVTRVKNLENVLNEVGPVYFHT